MKSPSITGFGFTTADEPADAVGPGAKEIETKLWGCAFVVWPLHPIPIPPNEAAEGRSKGNRAALSFCGNQMTGLVIGCSRSGPDAIAGLTLAVQQKRGPSGKLGASFSSCNASCFCAV